MVVERPADEPRRDRGGGGGGGVERGPDGGTVAEGGGGFDPPAATPLGGGAAPEGRQNVIGAGSGIDELPNGGNVFQQADTGTADTDFTITHNLGVIPKYYRIVSADKGGSIYTGTVAATDTTLTLKHTAANANVWVEIIV